MVAVVVRATAGTVGMDPGSIPAVPADRVRRRASLARRSATAAAAAAVDPSPEAPARMVVVMAGAGRVLETMLRQIAAAVAAVIDLMVVEARAAAVL
jgi:hypothetical protein